MTIPMKAWDVRDTGGPDEAHQPQLREAADAIAAEEEFVRSLGVNQLILIYVSPTTVAAMPVHHVHGQDCGRA